ncbi:MAG: hypothetical protein PHU75_09880 [Candidatus Nanopelagicales bacterium]|nr:hypothetical protein [Candidatus Nanopelagicales bacterium]
MSTTSVGGHEHAGTYEIRLRGHLEPRWNAWFVDMTLTTDDDGTTVVAGPVADQAALQGLLRKIHDMGIELMSLTRLDPEQAAPQHSEAHHPPKG